MVSIPHHGVPDATHSAISSSENVLFVFEPPLTSMVEPWWRSPSINTGGISSPCPRKSEADIIGGSPFGDGFGYFVFLLQLSVALREVLSADALEALLFKPTFVFRIVRFGSTHEGFLGMIITDIYRIHWFLINARQLTTVGLLFSAYAVLLEDSILPDSSEIDVPFLIDHCGTF